MIKLAIMVGHKEAAKGAKAVAPINDHEYDWNGDLAKRMLKEAERIENFEARIFYRDNGGVSQAYGEVRSWGADAAMELHFNAATATATGTETLYVTAPSEGLAKRVQEATVNILGLKDRGIKTPHDASGGRGHKNLVQMGSRPSILTEPFFGSNEGDAARAHVNKAKLAKAQLRAAAEYLLAPFDNGDELHWSVTADVLNVRGGPDATYEKVGDPLSKGDEVILIERHNIWFLVDTKDGRRAFVHSAFLA